MKIDKKQVQVGAQELMLLLWDIEGAEKVEEVAQILPARLCRLLLVADGTRRDTLYKALEIHERAERDNRRSSASDSDYKSDLVEQWNLDHRELEVWASGAGR